MSATRDNLIAGVAWSNDRQRCGIAPAPRKTTTVPKVLRVGRKGRRRSAVWRNR